MKYTRFEQLPVWQDAIALAVKVFALTDNSTFKGYRGDQIERAAVSISNNIAEGFERGTTPELLTFLYISRGSSGETRSVLCLLEHLPGFANAESISRQLRGWCDSLQNSDIPGQRYLTDKSRRISKEARERDEFLEELRRMRERNQPKPSGEKG